MFDVPFRMSRCTRTTLYDVVGSITRSCSPAAESAPVPPVIVADSLDGQRRERAVCPARSFTRQFRRAENRRLVRPIDLGLAGSEIEPPWMATDAARVEQLEDSVRRHERAAVLEEERALLWEK